MIVFVWRLHLCAGARPAMKSGVTKRAKYVALVSNTRSTQATENTDREMAVAAEPVASVVPLAFTNTLRALKQQVDPAVVKTREGWTDRQGNLHMVEYVEWHAVADILDRVVPNWQHAVRNVPQIG